MKKMYTKPCFAVELFTMSQSIASGCDLPPEGSTFGSPNYGGKTECGWNIGGLIVFQTVENGCTHVQVGPDDQFMGYCYNNPDGGLTVFGSF